MSSAFERTITKKGREFFDEKKMTPSVTAPGDITNIVTPQQCKS